MGTTRTLTVGDERLTYTLDRSDDATEPRIDVGIHGTTVVLPTDDDTDPDALLADNWAWVQQRREKFAAYREAAPDRTFAEGEMFPYLGTDREIVVESRPSATLDPETIRLPRQAVTKSSVRRALENFYRRQARAEFTDRADRYAAEMEVSYTAIEVRNQRTKWGSCSGDGTLGLNWRLLLARPEIVDYVVVHELAHLEVANHTDAFWRLVADHDPDYRDHAAWLDENSSQLIFSADDL